MSKIHSRKIHSQGASTQDAPIEGALILKDGEVFEGNIYGAIPDGGIVSGEVVFNTVLSGYQEVITDPSYAGQIITFTYPLIGNYGTTPADAESRQAFCRGMVVRDLQMTHSNWRSDMGVVKYLSSLNLSAISDIDTRRLTKHIRDQGSMSGAFGTAGESALLAAAKAEPGTSGIDLVAQVTCASSYMSPYMSSHKPSHKASKKRKKGQFFKNTGPKNIVAMDFGIKTSILGQLNEFAHVEVVPADTKAAEILERKPDGVFLSNGPGDPECIPYIQPVLQELLGEVPIFGICLGFQLLGQALGAKTYKLPFGHHGGNHPVMRLSDREVEITSQNHNFAVDPESLDAGIEITHINLNDQTLEGFYSSKLRVMGIQYHPEAGPGPHDSRYLFQSFLNLMDKTDAS